MKPTPSQRDQEILKLLEALRTDKVEYPPELLAKRRAALTEKLGRLEEHPGGQDARSLDKEALIETFENLRRMRFKYPPLLLAKQRAAFLAEVAKHRKVNRIEALSTAILNWLSGIARLAPTTNDLHRSLVVLSLLLAAYASIMVFDRQEGLTELAGSQLAHFPQKVTAQPTTVVPIGASKITKTSCTPDSATTPCLTHGFTESSDQTSWVSYTPNSWIKIDIGRTVSINKVELDGKNLDDSTGEFTVSVARSDGKYEEVYDSRSGNDARSDSETETIQISFEPVLARYIKVTVVDPGAGVRIEEVRAFAVMQAPLPDRTTEDEEPSVPPVPTVRPSSTPLPTNTPAPTDTLWPTSTPSPTATPWPSDTPAPTDTLWPTATPSPTATPWPSDTPAPTDTLWPTTTPLPTGTPFATDTTPAQTVTTSPTEAILEE